MTDRPHARLGGRSRLTERSFFGFAALALAIFIYESVTGVIANSEGLLASILFCLALGGASRFFRRRAEFSTRYPGYDSKDRA
jgi:hypothetical protein